MLPLSTAALEIVEGALDRADEDKDAPLFTRIGEPIEAIAIAKAARLKLQVTDEAWTPHDIRRTVATNMAELGIAPARKLPERTGYCEECGAAFIRQRSDRRFCGKTCAARAGYREANASTFFCEAAE